MAPLKPSHRSFKTQFLTISIGSLLVFGIGLPQQTGVNFYITAGREASPSEGDSLYRAVFLIESQPAVKGPLFLRVFDADVGGKYDQNVTPSKARYRLFGKPGVDGRIRSINDPLPGAAPLMDLEIGEDNLYDGQWRTLASFNPGDGEPADSLSTFELIVDGIRGKSMNLYRIFISSEEKRNTPVEGLRMTTPVVTVLIPLSDRLVTQIPFFIPQNSKVLAVHNFDAESMGEIFVQTTYREKVPVCVSVNGSSCSSLVQIQENEWGTRAALIIGGIRTKADHVQCWITDEAGTTRPLFLPPVISPMNHLPFPQFEAVPLSDCLSFVLDASASSDPDGDEMSFTWSVGKQSVGEGRRIVHRFAEPGEYPVQLSVKDHSGFAADTKRLVKTVKVNSAPFAEFDVPSNAAPGEELMFDAVRSGDRDGRIVQYVWDFGDGAKAEGRAVRHAYGLPGRYRSVLRVRDDSKSPCNGSEKTAVISVNSAPVPILKIAARAAVDEEVRMDGLGSMDSDGEIVRYSWDLGDGAKAEGASVSHQYRTPGTYGVRIEVSDNAGVKNSTQSAEALIAVNAPPVADVKGGSVIAADETVTLDASGSSDPDGRIVEYAWDTGDGSSETGMQVRHAYRKPGLYELRLTVRDNSGTSNDRAEARFPIRVNFPPVPDAGRDRVVNTSAVFFDAAASKDEDDPIVDYIWDFGDSRFGRGRQVWHAYALPGSYPVKLTVRDGSGTVSAVQSATITVMVNHPPVADAGRRRIVATGEKVILDASFSHDPDGEIVDYLWEPEKGIIKTGKITDYVYPVPGTYQARLFIRDNAGAEDEHSVEIVVNAKPTARILPVERRAPGQEMTFDGSGSFDLDGRIMEAVWDFGDGSARKFGLKATHVYSKPDRYLAVLTVRDDSQASNSIDVQTATVTVNHTPVAVAGQDRQGCSQTVLFDGSKSADEDSDPLLLSWNFGDSAAGSGARVSHTYERPGVYPVRLVADDGNGLPNSKTEAFIKVHINSPPHARILAQENVCAGETILLDAGRSSDTDNDPMKYGWDFGDGTAGEGVNPVHVFKTGGYYRIRLTVTDNSGLPCNSSLAETVVHVIDAPFAEAGPDQTVCANTPVTFDGSLSIGGSRSIQGYEWDFGDGRQGGGVKALHTYPQAGLYTVRLKITVPLEGACENASEDEMTLKVLPSPMVAFSSSPIGCTGEAILFDAGASNTGNASAGRYAWDFGDGTSGSGMQIAHRYLQPGRYAVQLTLVTDADQECNTAYLERALLINAKPHAAMELSSADGPSSITPFSAMAFNAGKSEDADGVIRRYDWDFGDGKTAEGVFVHHAYERPGNYNVKLVVEDNSGTSCATDTAMQPLTVSVARPPWFIKSPQNVCAGEPFTLTLRESATGPPAEDPVLWFFSGGDTIQGNPITRTFRDPGKYQVQALCRESWSMAGCISVAGLPEIWLLAKAEIGMNEALELKPLIFDRGGLPVEYRWDWGDGTTADRPQAVHAYKAPGNYTASLLVRHQGRQSCPSVRREVLVTVTPEPELGIRISPDTLYSGGARDEASFSVVQTDSTPEMECRWDFGDGQTAAGRSVMHAYRRPGAFSVQLTARDASRRSGKTFIVQKRVTVLPR